MTVSTTSYRNGLLTRFWTLLGPVVLLKCGSTAKVFNNVATRNKHGWILVNNQVSPAIHINCSNMYRINSKAQTVDTQKVSCVYLKSAT